MATTNNCISLKRADEQSKKPSTLQIVSAIMTPSLSQMKVMILMMLLIVILRLNATKQSHMDQNQRTYMDLRVIASCSF